jgi:hypothetical protein
VVTSFWQLWCPRHERLAPAPVDGVIQVWRGDVRKRVVQLVLLFEGGGAAPTTVDSVGGDSPNSNRDSRSQ